MEAKSRKARRMTRMSESKSGGKILTYAHGIKDMVQYIEIPRLSTFVLLAWAIIVF